MNNHHKDHKDQAIEILDAELERKEEQLREIDAEIEKLEGRKRQVYSEYDKTSGIIAQVVGIFMIIGMLIGLIYIGFAKILWIPATAVMALAVFLIIKGRKWVDGSRREEKEPQKRNKDEQINQLMHDYERDVFGMWGGDKEKADAMSASEIQEKWEEHQKKLREIGFL